MAELDEIRRAALEARERFESGKIDKNKLARLYHEYNPISDTKTFVRRSRRLFPSLNCGLASLYLRDNLRVGEVVRGKYHGENHTFLLIDDEVVVDITADQYGGPEVYVGPLKKPWER